MIPQKAFYYIRHGKTFHNLEGKCSGGGVDAQLTETGKKQAEAARMIVESLNVQPSCIVHTGLSRTINTAAIINQTLQLPVHEVTELKEMMLGSWEEVPQQDAVPKLNEGIDPPDGETHEMFYERISRGFHKALALAEAPVLIVAHSRLLRNIPPLYDMPRGGNNQNCAVHEFVPKGNNETFPWTVWHHQSDGSKIPAEVFKKI